MNKYVFFVFATLLVGCASNRPSDFDQEDKRLLRSIGTTNGQVLGTYGTDKSSDFSKFTEKDYLAITGKGDSLSRKTFREDYTSLEAKEIVPYPNTFVMCGFSPKLQLAFCDDASCEGVEHRMRTRSRESIKDLKAQILKPGVCSN